MRRATSPGVALLLPGMTLNATLFPSLAAPTIGVDFTRLVLSEDGSSPELLAQGMRLYVDRLTSQLRHDPRWNTAPRIVVGHSFGGMLALAWLLDGGAPDLTRIDGLVLIGTTAGPMYDIVRLRLLGMGNTALRVPVRTLMRAWNLPTVTRAIARLTGGMAPADVDFRTLHYRSDLAVGLAGWRNTDWRARRSYRLALNGFDVRNRLWEITVRTIVLHGSRDVFFPRTVGEALTALLPHAELRLVPGAAHCLPLTHGEWVRRAVHDLRE